MNNRLLYPYGSDSPVWDKIKNDLEKEDLLDYEVVIPDGAKRVVLRIDIDLGGGFEGGYASTSLSAILTGNTNFRFAVHKENFIDEIGKFFGMQDVKIGFEEFDKKVIVKTNDENTVKRIFSEPQIRETLLSLEDFSFGIHTHHTSKEKEPFLEIVINDAVTDVDKLKKLYSTFYIVLEHLETRNETSTASVRF